MQSRTAVLFIPWSLHKSIIIIIVIIIVIIIISSIVITIIIIILKFRTAGDVTASFLSGSGYQQVV